MEQHNKKRVIELELYTDGSCKRHNLTTFGAWAFIAVRDNNREFYAADSMLHTTNQRMELQAIINALEYAAQNRRPNEHVIVYSDSAYAINCYNQQWYLNWINNGWLNSQNKPVSNRDLWDKIIPYFDNFWYSFKKVDGHAGVYWNELCDKLAQEQAQKAKINYRGPYEQRIV